MSDVKYYVGFHSPPFLYLRRSRTAQDSMQTHVSNTKGFPRHGDFLRRRVYAYSGTSQDTNFGPTLESTLPPNILLLLQMERAAKRAAEKAASLRAHIQFCRPVQTHQSEPTAATGYRERPPMCMNLERWAGLDLARILLFAFS